LRFDLVNVVLNLESDICLKVGILLRKMWDARNKMNAGEKALSSQEVCGATICMLMEIQDGAEMKIQQPHSGVCMGTAGRGLPKDKC
jgi:hypothetical protein